MQQFVVPQFIDVEDKIFGPITTRQFLILLATGLLLFVIYRFADFALFVTLTAIIGGIALVVAFVRVNGQSFHYFLLNIIQTRRRPKLRIWNRSYTKEELNYLRKKEVEVAVEEELTKTHPERRHIRDLALTVNTGGYYKPDEF